MTDTVLLTGATGQVGAALLPRLLAGADTRVIALVRARDDAHLASRAAALRKGLGDPGARLEVVRGDVTEPGLGLGPADRARVLAEADAVLHSAAAVRFDLPEADAVAQNVGGTLAALAFARALGSRLRRFDHVSTAYVAGLRQGRVHEAECDEGQAFRNSYERTKCRAEMVVRAAMRELPCAIHRPAIVVGDSRTGETRAFNVLYWPLKIYARGWWGLFPGRADCVVDVVPVDWVADSIVALRRQETTLGGCFHLAAGDEAATVEQLAGRIQALTGGRPIRYVDQATYRAWVRPLLSPFRLSKQGKALTRGGNVFMPYFVANPLFDTRAVRAALGEAGRAPPFLDYLETVVKWALARDFGGQGAAEGQG